MVGDSDKNYSKSFSIYLPNQLVSYFFYLPVSLQSVREHSAAVFDGYY